jgi:hypothetical protein
MRTKWLIGATLFLLFFVAVVSCVSELRPWVNPEDFKIYVLNNTNYDPALARRLDGSYENIKPVIQGLNLDQPFFVITVADIETYDWGRQTITLTKDATQRMGDRWQFYHRIFVVTLGKDRLYGGLMTHQLSAERFEFPAISYDGYLTDQAGWEIRPVFDLRQYSELDPKLKAIIEVDAVHTLFRRLGKIR